jgi:flagellar hook-associated protein 3 FlgL
MRITSNMFADTFVIETQRLQLRQINAQKAIASGQRIHTSSDDPAAFRQSLETQSAQRTRLQFLDNIRDATSRTEINHSYSIKVHELATRVSEILTRVNASYTQTEFDAAANEISGILEQAVSIGNAQHEGQFLFGGTYLQPSDADGAAAYVPFRVTRDAAGSIVGVEYRGNQGLRSTSIDANLGIEVNLIGETAGTSPRGLFESGTADFFQSIIVLRNELALKNTTNIQGHFTNLRNIDENIATVIGLTSSNLSRLKIASETHENRQLVDEGIVSRLLDTDMVKEATDLQRSLSAYEAALQTGARVLNTSLLDYL